MSKNRGGIFGLGILGQRIRPKETATMDYPPDLYKGLRSQIQGAIAHEKEAIDDYAALERDLRDNGMPDRADTVREIRTDEIDHLEKFELMLRSFPYQEDKMKK